MSSSPDHMELAHRVCDASKTICELLSSRVPIKILRSDHLIRSPEDQPINATTTSLSVEEQTAHFARLDAISAQIDEWEGITPTKTTKSRLKRIESEETSQSVNVSDDTINVKDIKAFNDQRFSDAVDITTICENDKQSFQQIQQAILSLQEVVKQIEDSDVIVEKQSTTPRAENRELTGLLDRFNQVKSRN